MSSPRANSGPSERNKSCRARKLLTPLNSKVSVETRFALKIIGDLDVLAAKNASTNAKTGENVFGYFEPRTTWTRGTHQPVCQ